MRTRIETIVNALPATFVYGVMSDFNFATDGSPFPVVCMLPALIEGEATQSHYLHTYTVVLLFVTDGSIGSTTAQRATNVENMLELAKEFLAELIKSINAEKRRESRVLGWLFHSLDPEEKSDFNQFFNAFDQQVDGYGLTVRVNLLEDPANCIV